MSKKYKVAVIVGSLRKDSINRKGADATLSSSANGESTHSVIPLVYHAQPPPNPLWAVAGHANLAPAPW